MKTYYGVNLERCAPNASGMRWHAMTDNGQLRSDTLDGMREMIRAQQPARDKFKRANGRLTAYALACGDLEATERNGDKQAVTMGSEGAVYFVKQRIRDDAPAWETFPHTTQGYREALALFDTLSGDTWQAELTDTFAGEANYVWVRRATFITRAGASQRAIVRDAKRALDLVGDWNTDSDSEGYTMRPRGGACLVVFVSPV